MRAENAEAFAQVHSDVDDQKADLFLLKPGDLIEVERGKDGRAQKIMVVARAWDG